MFKPLTVDQPISWMRLPSLVSRERIWVPAQFVYLGYRLRTADNEPRLNACVTTGTAAHPTEMTALYNAICELIQIDSAIGHWYTDSRAEQILLDDSVASLQRVIDKHSPLHAPKSSFYHLPNPTFSLRTVACVLQHPTGQIPKVAVGLGCDQDIERAMYSAYLEAIGVYQLAKIVLLRQQYSGAYPIAPTPQDMYDLDANVAFYASGNNLDFFAEKFSDAITVSAQSLKTPDIKSHRACLQEIIQNCREQGIELLFADLTNREAEQLGLTVTRVWSPELLSLPLPSAVPRNHNRFEDYGGISYDHPHPYP